MIRVLHPAMLQATPLFSESSDVVTFIGGNTPTKSSSMATFAGSNKEEDNLEIGISELLYSQTSEVYEVGRGMH